MLWEENYLAHYGITGMRWGVRRFQNKDGTLTPEGKERYSKGNSDSSSDYKSERRKVAKNRPQGFSEKENKLISKIENGEVIDIEQVRKISSNHFTRHSELSKKYQTATSETEKNRLKQEMEHEQILMDYAYDKIPALNRENKYEKEIANETDTRYIDPVYQKFASKEEKAAAEAEYLQNVWHNGRPRDEGEAKKWERECQHISDRVWSLSFDGYDGKPQSDRVRSMFDYDPEGYRPYERWKPKYEKSDEWKKIQAERQVLKDKVGFDKAEKEFDKAGKDGLFFNDKAAWLKVSAVFSKAQKKYEKLVDRAGIKDREKKIEDAFYNEVIPLVLKDLGYEITKDNIRLIQSVIWYD